MLHAQNMQAFVQYLNNVGSGKDGAHQAIPHWIWCAASLTFSPGLSPNPSDPRVDHELTLSLPIGQVGLERQQRRHGRHSG
jgi:hypothetical protein